MKCKICDSNSEKIFEKTVLQKYKSFYYRCSNCSFVQTDEPIWLKEAYESAITSLDIGLANRNIILRNEIRRIIDNHFPKAKLFLDYAGGYGMFVRLMRDIGFDFYRQDDYCENIFANYFDLTDVKISQFDIVTGFEVLEHFNNPLEEIKKIFSYSETAIFSTELSPELNDDIEKWWYITPETGQHIAFYTKKSMQIIAQKFGKNYYCRNGNIHIFTPLELNDFQVKRKKYFGIKMKFPDAKIKRESLTDKDYQYILGILNK